jgi:putative membrane protein
MAQKFFSKSDLEKITHAVEKAEKGTSGEIVTAFIHQSYDYAIYELMSAIIIGLVYFTMMSFALPAIQNLISQMLWTDTKIIYYTLIFYGFSTFFVIGLFYFLFNIPFLDRLIIPKKVMERKVYERAVQHFFESGVRNTKDRTGVLIFLSFLEKRVVLLADSGINEKITQEKWQHIVDQIIKGIHKKQMTDYLATAIEMCGELLAEHFPVLPEDKNELANEFQVLEK